MTLYDFLHDSARCEWMRLVTGIQSPDRTQLLITGNEPFDLPGYSESLESPRIIGMMRYERNQMADGRTWGRPGLRKATKRYEKFSYKYLGLDK